MHTKTLERGLRPPVCLVLFSKKKVALHDFVGWPLGDKKGKKERIRALSGEQKLRKLPRRAKRRFAAPID